jgi:hypothetical protein
VIKLPFKFLRLKPAKLNNDYLPTVSSGIAMPKMQPPKNIQSNKS